MFDKYKVDDRILRQEFEICVKEIISDTFKRISEEIKEDIKNDYENLKNNNLDSDDEDSKNEDRDPFNLMEDIDILTFMAIPNLIIKFRNQQLEIYKKFGVTVPMRDNENEIYEIPLNLEKEAKKAGLKHI